MALAFSGVSSSQGSVSSGCALSGVLLVSLSKESSSVRSVCVSLSFSDGIWGALSLSVVSTEGFSVLTALSLSVELSDGFSVSAVLSLSVVSFDGFSVSAVLPLSVVPSDGF